MKHLKHFAEILSFEFESRKKVNQAYSLRCFAGKLEIAPSKLSEILNYKQGLSEKAALKIGKSLKYNISEMNHFICTVRAHSSKSPAIRKKFMQELETLKISNDDFEMVSNWYYFAILELVSFKDFKNDADWIAKKLGISSEEAERALTQLISQGFLKETRNGLKKSHTIYQATDGIVSPAIRRINEQLIFKARQAIYEQSIEQRYLSTLTVGVNPEILPEVFEKIAEFRKELNQFMTGHPKNQSKKTQVYSLTSQFFQLTKGTEGDHCEK
ncbi:MAG: DUF4423 domain-containing protein [Bacteriovoracaceae bacterium]